MKKILTLAALFAVALTSNAQKLSAEVSKAVEKLERQIEKIELTPCTDPEYDWNQYDEKTGKAIMGKKTLLLESKKDDVYCITFSELPISMKDDDFLVRLVMEPDEISDDEPFGIVYDVEDETNYRMLLAFKKSFQLVNVKDGKQSVVKKGIYKLKTKSKDVELDVARMKNKLYFFINGMEFLSIKSPEMENPMFGFVVSPKTKMECKSIGFWKQNPNNDENED